MQPLIECRNLSKRYKDVYALDGVNLTIPDTGGIVGLLGPNGSGKTTLIKILMGLLTPTDGTAKILGREIGVETKSIASYLSDFNALNGGYKVKDQLDYYGDFFLDFNREKAEKMLKELGIGLDRKIKTLSKGTKEKLALILTLSRNARVYFLDEPIAGVDPAAREYVLSTILNNRSQNSTIFLSTHLISEIEQYFDWVIFLKEGRVVLEGNAENIRQAEGKTIDALFREVFRWMVW
ncbi:MAG: ABC transporter ATP-binding protein [Clostridia bacterium]|nr:ABC transporter ATP-binding protein [Clostridia bacterium]